MKKFVLLEKVLRRFRYRMLLVIFFLLISFLLLLILAGQKLLLALGGILAGLEWNEVLGQIIDVLDISILCVILLLIAWWLYEMFIHKLEVSKHDQRLADEVFIHNIDDLKAKLWKVIIISLVVHAFKQFLTYDMQQATDMLILSWSVVLIAWAMFLISKMNTK